ncbi:PRC-barrel domain-containing protein [Acetonema longum]|uniref:PRC-barrel domain protein n=1 Tax=Acetonema longum DSM 6540 TaxID=1009370 RepID=F7NJN9_9FIRM|nr:PRC-barrel domain-containing protein [Acetonema longum]EGO63743.1 PRC-barrel domain protein [Acetonema longum DSM 6540]
MQKSKDILHLPVVSILEGKELGLVRDLVINPADAEVIALAIDAGMWYLGAKILSFSAIKGLGKGAVTIETSDDLLPIFQVPEAVQFLNTGVKIIGTKVLSNTGQIQGKINEFYLDEAGRIISCEIENLQGETIKVPANRFITLGKDVLIITDSKEPDGGPELSNAAAYQNVTPLRPLTRLNSSEEEHHAGSFSIEDFAHRSDDKQRQYLLGKKSTRRIQTETGVVIVEHGAEITEEVIQKAKLAGKYLELAMHP